MMNPFADGSRFAQNPGAAVEMGLADLDDPPPSVWPCPENAPPEDPAACLRTALSNALEVDDSVSWSCPTNEVSIHTFCRPL